MFRAIMCPSSGADGCMMLWPRVGMCRGCREVVKSGWQVVRPWMGSYEPIHGRTTYQQDPHQDSIPGPSSPYPVATPTELPDPHAN